MTAAAGTSLPSPFKVVHTVCSHDCPDSCGVLVTVDGTGRAVKVQGDPGHPVTQGFLCGKVAKYLDRVYAPERVLYPLKRKSGVAKGPLKRGEEHKAFERVSWDEALDSIAERLRAVAEEFGPESILPYSYAGTIGQLGYGSMDRRFFHRLGASQLDRTICSEAGGEAWKLVYGKKLGTPPEDYALAKLVVAWGANIHGNNVHLWPMIEQARRAGGRLIVIDPYRTRTAALADWHIAIRPGTDGALALGMMRVILNEGLAERVKEYTPARVAEWTGMTAAEIEGLAREYATTWPTALRVNYGLQRTEYGGEAMRTIAMLPALTGAWKHRGGGGGLSLSGAFEWDEDALRRPDLAMASPLKRLARTVNMCELGEALEERGSGVSGLGSGRVEGTVTEGPGTTGPRALDCPPVKALFVYNSNPGAVAPDQNAVRRGLARTDLFTVVHEQFFNDTTDYADYVLPATTFLEHTDIQGAYGHYYVGLSEQAIEPPGEARSNVWLFGQLGQRMGFEEACFRDTPEEMVKQALGIGTDGHSQNPGMEHITLEDLKERGHIPLAFHRNALIGHSGSEPFLPYAGEKLATPSGKIEFDSEVLKARGSDGLPRFKPPTESRWGEDAKRYPLEFLSRKADNYMNSTFANLDGHRKMEAQTNQRLEMHPADAAARGIGEGDAVRIWNDRGEMRLTAMLNAHLPAGVVAGKLDWGKMNADGANVNALTSQRLTDIGAGATFYSTLVEVGKG